MRSLPGPRRSGLLVVGALYCLVLGVHVQVPLQGPHVLVVVARGGDHLEADVAQGVQHHDAGALQPDAVLRVPALLVLHVFREFALWERSGKRRVFVTCRLSLFLQFIFLLKKSLWGT